MIVHCIDFETLPISSAAPYPKPVCFSYYATGLPEPELYVDGQHDVVGELRLILEKVLEGDRLVNQNIAFDMRVLCNEWPQLERLVIEAYNTGRVGCTMIREKLLQLSRHGGIDARPTVCGSSIQLRYSLADLVRTYFGEDISDTKKGPDVWRLRYGELALVPVEQWPLDAVIYAKDDALWAWKVWNAQSNPVPRGDAEAVHTRADFAHSAMTERGMLLDPSAAQRAWDETRERFKLTNFPLLEQRGILIAAQPPKPYANGARDRDGNLKMTKAKAETKKLAAWRGHCLDAARHRAVAVDLTDKGITGFEAEFGERKLKVDAAHRCFDSHPEWLAAGKSTYNRLASLGDRVAQEYADRAKVDKLVTSYFPSLLWDYAFERSGKKVLKWLDGTSTPEDDWTPEGSDLRWARVVRPVFDILKETGRCSSYSSSLFPSVNIQQVDPRIRPLYVARPGYILVAVDYSALELYSAAATWKSCIGYSVLYDVLTTGRDPHGYLAAQLYNEDDKLSGIPGVRYEQFLKWKEDDPERYARWRKFAKAVGLGFPGGLGVDKFVGFAWANHGIEIDRDEAVRAREVWLNTYPEARDYLKIYVPKYLVDLEWSGLDEDGNKNERYCYTTPRGMVRANCTYTAAANGNALQSPSAEGVKIATWAVYEATKEPSSPLGKSFLVAAIHDELLLEVPIEEDYSNTQAAIDDVGILMRQEMEAVLNIAVKTEATASYRWRKGPSPEMVDAGIYSLEAYDDDGRLVPADEYPEEFYEKL